MAWGSTDGAHGKRDVMEMVEWRPGMTAGELREWAVYRIYFAYRSRSWFEKTGDPDSARDCQRTVDHFVITFFS